MRKFVVVMLALVFSTSFLIGANLVWSGMSFQAVLGDSITTSTDLTNSTDPIILTADQTEELRAAALEPTPTPTLKPIPTPTPLLRLDTTTATPTTTDSQVTTTTVELVLKLDPYKVQLAPLQKKQFKAYVETKDGRQVIDPKEVAWSVSRGGGRIDQDGVFQAWDAAGTYQDTVVAKYRDRVVRATVVIVNATTSSDQTSITQLAPTPKPTSTTVDSVIEKEITSISQPEYFTANESIKTDQVYDADLLRSCLLQSFSESEIQKYFSQTGLTEDLSPILERKTAIERCIKQTRLPNITAQTEQCLKTQLGTERYQEIVLSGDIASAKELFYSSGCFTEPQRISYQKSAELDPNVMTCLRLELGDEKIKAIESGQKLSATDLMKGRECFNLEKNEAEPPKVIEPDPDTANCVIAALGAERAEQIKLSKTSTANEQAKVRACLQQVDRVQQEFLPLPAEYISFVPINGGQAAIKTVAIQDRETKKTFTLTGQTFPDSVVDIYIFSEPIVVSTTSDANGNWDYELYYHLPEGTHQAYSVVSHPEKGQIRSEVFGFDVAYAQTVSGESIIPELVSVTPVSQDFSKAYLGVAVMITSSALLIVLGMYYYRNRSAVVANGASSATQSPTQSLSKTTAPLTGQAEPSLSIDPKTTQPSQVELPKPNPASTTHKPTI